MTVCKGYICLMFLFHNVVIASSDVPVLERHIDKSGFHRDLITTVRIPASLLQDVNGDNGMECSLLFTEIMPSGAYLDKHQLSALFSHGGPDVLINEVVDIEQPEFSSDDFQALVFVNLSYVAESFIGSYTLPVHLRYHAISKEEYVPVTFENPEMAIRCINKDIGMPHHGYQGKSKKQNDAVCDRYNSVLCEWTVIEYQSNVDKITIDVPVGKEEHYYIVAAGTVLTTSIACLLLLFKTLYTDNKSKIS